MMSDNDSNGDSYTVTDLPLRFRRKNIRGFFFVFIKHLSTKYKN